MEWLRHVTHVLRDELQTIDFRVISDFSPAIGAAVQRGEIDLGFSRIEPQPNVTYKIIAHEPIVVVLPREHPLAARKEIERSLQADPKYADAWAELGLVQIRADQFAEAERSLAKALANGVPSSSETWAAWMPVSFASVPTISAAAFRSRNASAGATKRSSGAFSYVSITRYNGYLTRNHHIGSATDRIYA